MSCPREVDVGAYLLDALEPDERMGMAAHLRGCPVCSGALGELGGLPPLLAAVRPGDVHAEAPVPSEVSFQRLRRSAVPLRPARLRHRRLLAGAVAAVVVVGGGIGAGVVLTSGPAEPATMQGSAGDLHAWATVAAEGNGSSISLTTEGLPRGTTCWLVAVGRDGERHRTRSWTTGREGELSWTGTIALAPEQLARLELVGGDGRTLVTLPG
ncbi:zf-HC2 domain-containing protein [Blastococcus sp. MG754426]|uniref:zf-HC2 domain-containing protein n=1 Tax=unclassified Blastococcus TaxID=2619396 RepID=UPI001EEFEFA5|nr:MULTISPECIES: zf-HC2 domain-containing protein [unclassified Blastococcus]MCF6507164.1 zf-HC2 domain-containing protein [Blastococcus sp. MG754426]MCF6512670.1 zf-HC2 domain-containing protein [Blastococcus sp. MG754427]